jgi:hypothetical protein
MPENEKAHEVGCRRGGRRNGKAVKATYGPAICLLYPDGLFGNKRNAACVNDR